mgnify:CR=1 FL=1
MIDNHKTEDLARLYRLYSRVSAGLPCLKRALRASIILRGKEINDASSGPIAGEAEGGDDQEDDAPKKDKGKGKARSAVPSQAAIKWVQDVLDLKDLFDGVWKNSFSSDRDIEATLNEVCHPVQLHRMTLTVENRLLALSSIHTLKRRSTPRCSLTNTSSEDSKG